MAKRNGGIIGPSNVPTGQYGGVAPGVWRLRDAFNYIKAGLWPGLGNYSVGNTSRFNGPSSDYLNRTPASATNRKTFTFSFWIKRSRLGYEQYLYCTSPSNAQTQIIFSGGDVFGFDHYTTGYTTQVRSTQVFRDPSAWYHLMVAVDTTQATDSNRVKLYVNGSQITSLSASTYPTQNFEYSVNNTVVQNIGRWIPGPDNYFSGYMSEYNLIDGQQLTPSSFGVTDSTTGIWIPKPYYGTYGTNGFYLKFANSAALGTDSSGNGNTWTVNNLTSVDQSTDTPTNNFCTLNALSKGSALSLTNGNLTCTNDSTWRSVMSTIAVSTGKWYWEAKVVSLGTINFGVTKSKQNGTDHDNVDAGRVMWSSNGNLYDEGFGNSPVSIGTFTTNDIIGLALDLINGTLALYKNGTLVYTYSNAGLTTNEMTPANGVNTATGDMNFGSPPFTIASGNADANGFGNFEYAVPSGYYALCTKNLATYG